MVARRRKFYISSAHYLDGYKKVVAVWLCPTLDTYNIHKTDIREGKGREWKGREGKRREGEGRQRMLFY